MEMGLPLTSIVFTAAVARVATLADGGLRLTLDLPESDIAVAAQMMECKRVGAVIEFEGIPKLKAKTEYGGRLKSE